MQNLESNKKIKYILYTSISILSIIIIISLLFLLPRIGKQKVLIKYAPFVAEVEINNQLLKNNAINYITPGSYTLKVSLDEFNIIEKDIEINNNTEVLYGMLTPNSELGQQIKEKYSNDFKELEKYYAQTAVNQGQKDIENCPIISNLPIKNALFTIGATMDTENHCIINITTSTTYLNNAVEKVKSLDTNIPLSSYEINFSIENPFSLKESREQDPKKFIQESLISNKKITIYDGKMFDDYYYTKLTTGKLEEYSLVTYKIIIKKDNNEWTTTSVPNPILTIYNTPNVPIEILNIANSL